MSNKCALVRSTCNFVAQRAKHVKINGEKLRILAEKLTYKPFREEIFHQTQQSPERALFQIFMLDCMNFCFWPLDNFEYDNLATHVQQATKEGIQLSELTTITEEEVINKIFHGVHVPLADSRAKILREMSSVVINQFEGSFVKIINLANKSAVNLLSILTQYFPNFQDHSIYEGHQIHFYKRGQILIGDIFGKFNSSGMGEFNDIDQLTMFPDYRVPQILEAEEVFVYSEYLKQIIHSKTQITDRYLQIQLRASTVAVVQQMKEYLHSLGKNVKSCELDWCLWQLGESRLATLQPHHRCLTIYY